MVGRVPRLDGEHFADQGVDRELAVDRHAVQVVVPDLPEQEGLGFEIVRVLAGDRLVLSEQSSPATGMVVALRRRPK